MDQVGMEAVLQQVKERIRDLGLSIRDAAAQIGITVGSLDRHLNGNYVRSDSLGRYRSWLEGRKNPSKQRQSALFQHFGAVELADVPILRLELPDSNLRPHRPYKVVDLFSGCGGMSLGFE